MNIDKTVETRGVVTPNCAMASRNQTNSYRMLQKPEMKKKRKNQPVDPEGLEEKWFGILEYPGMHGFNDEMVAWQDPSESRH